MNSYHAILDSLKGSLSLNKPSLNVLSGLVLGVISCRDVSLQKLSAFQGSDAKDSSQYRKLQRFFKDCDIPWKDTAQLILSRIPKPKDGYVLSMDRTNWKYGKTHINILTIGVVIGKVAIPIIWVTLPQTTKRGNSNSHQRISLTKRLLKIMPAEDIYALTMDREFHGNPWLNWLNVQQVTWVLRLRRDIHVDSKPAKNYYSTRKNTNPEKKTIYDQQLYFGCKKISKGRSDFLYVASNNLTPSKALETYKKRWSIEVLFGHLKKKGFNFENTHMTAKKKIDKLVVVLTFSFLFTIGFGVLLKEKTTLSVTQKRKSTFRLALDLIHSMFVKPKLYKRKLTLFQRWITSAVEPQNFVV